MRRLLAVLVLLAASGPAMAEPKCGPAADMEKVLADKYGEAPVLAGIGNSGSLLVVYGNGATGTYTVMVKSPDGLMACAMMSGEGLKVTPPTDASGKET